jgi:SAM-dependent methyltransferase
MNPRPSAAVIRRRYGVEYGGAYLAYEKKNEAAFLRLQERALEDAGFYALEAAVFSESRARESSPRVLDIGCATGSLLAALKERGWDTIGLEIAREEAEYARARGLDVRAKALEEARFESGAFDAVCASHLIEHLTDPASFTEALYRVVRPGGRIYITTPNIDGFQAQLFGGKWRSAIFDHLYLFSRATLSGLFERHGFTTEKIITWGGLAEGTAAAPVKRIADRLAKRLNAGDVMILRAVKNEGRGGPGGK